MSGLQRQSRFERGEDVVVMKFGGTSVEDAAAIQRVISIVKTRLNARPVLVVSALAKVTDQLLDAGKAAADGHLGAALATVRDIYVRHEQLADSLLGASSYGSLDRQLRSDFRHWSVCWRNWNYPGVWTRKRKIYCWVLGSVFPAGLFAGP